MNRHPSMHFRLKFSTLLLAAVFSVPASSITAQTPAAKPDAGAVERAAAGDTIDNPGPLATDLSPALNRAAILQAVKKVADWQIVYAASRANRQWTYAPLYDGLLAASKMTGDPKYKDFVIKIADGYKWELENARFPHADDEAVGHAWLDLYRENKDPIRLANIKSTMDKLVVRPDEPKLLWWWCDALFMAPPTLARTAVITGDKKYLDYMDHEWWLTSDKLYSPKDHLYFRDDNYFNQHEKNGQSIFWGRGNGWVMGAYAQVIPLIPAKDPRRAKYVAQYREMAERIAALQMPDGLWRSGLLDQTAYDLPEISGSAFFTYSLAWGINSGLLDRAHYQPVVEKAWAGLLKNVYADGRLGSIQPIGAAPGVFKPSSSYVYGIGGFLLAASELQHLKPMSAAKH